MKTFEFSEVQNLNFKSLSKYSFVTAISFYLFGIVNIIGIFSPTGRQYFFQVPLVTIGNILVIISCLLAGVAYKTASSKYKFIIKTEGNDLELVMSAGRNMQKAFTASSIVILVMLFRAIHFASSYDVIAK